VVVAKEMVLRTSNSFFLHFTYLFLNLIKGVVISLWVLLIGHYQFFNLLFDYFKGGAFVVVLNLCVGFYEVFASIEGIFDLDKVKFAVLEIGGDVVNRFLDDVVPFVIGDPIVAFECGHKGFSCLVVFPDEVCIFLHEA
jgi:hypothetical protein